MRVTNFDDMPTDKVMLLWTQAGAIAAVAAFLVSLGTLIYAVREFRMLLRAAKLQLRFSPNQPSKTSFCQPFVNQIATGGATYFDHGWVVELDFTLHNLGNATASDALVRLAVPLEHWLGPIVHQSEFVTPVDGATKHLIFAMQVDLPVYPEIPRSLPHIQLGCNLPGRREAPQYGLPVDARVIIYWQAGHADGVDPGSGKWSPLEVNVHYP
jgi:hypothetical protein